MQRLILLAGLLLAGCQAPSSTTHTDFFAEHLFDYQLHSPTGEMMSLADGAAQLAKADVIMVGELHGHQGVHRFQADLLAQLLKQPEPIALAMEQFSRNNQAVVDKYLANELGEDLFIKDSQAWPSYRSDYRALITLAKEANIAVIAANAPRNIVRCISQEGPDYLTRLPASERGWVADKLTLDDDAYKARFMENRHHGQAPTERQFAAQTTWDDTMADSIAQYLQQHPNSRVMLTVGRFHVAERLGTVQRLRQRNPALNVAVIYPVTATESQPETPVWTLQVAVLPATRLDGEPLPAYSSEQPECHSLSHSAKVTP
ncbi:ChaN family lipoprotein [Oceanisphaera pacifica]|uniref:ChaN family lipoprotein n=1 Tax=Oceanisphaera pacifica TaxID=2818389 RepID=A0ABS3NEW6_9GAMM|nr:ChaN family lipoprotein [Oceanisphaera pacifica]MBO1518912.1 ChaN family lipoprotein [Oceanisphaera pacifica]